MTVAGANEEIRRSEEAIGSSAYIGGAPYTAKRFILLRIDGMFTLLP